MTKIKTIQLKATWVPHMSIATLRIDTTGHAQNLPPKVGKSTNTNLDGPHPRVLLPKPPPVLGSLLLGTIGAGTCGGNPSAKAGPRCRRADGAEKPNLFLSGLFEATCFGWFKGICKNTEKRKQHFGIS